MNLQLRPNEGTSLLNPKVQRAITTRAKMYDFLFTPQTFLAHSFEGFIFLVIFANIVSFIVSTDPYLAGMIGEDNFDLIEEFSVVVFTLEYALRWYCCVEANEYKGAWGRLKWMGSFFAVIDLLAILPFYIDLATPDYEIIPSQWVRVVRLLRMFKADKYVHAFSVFGDVFREKKDILLMTGFVGVVLWILLGAVMWFFEKENPELEGRFASIPRAMWYVMLNLNGEFPINNEWTPSGKVVGCFMAIFACAVYDIPVSVIGSGFMNYAEGLDDEDEEGEELPPIPVDVKCGRCRAITAAEKGPRGQCYLFISADDFWGKLFEMTIFFLIFMNVFSFVLETVPAIHNFPGVAVAMDYFEAVSVIVFTIEYLMRLWSIVENPKYGHWFLGRLAFMMTFFAVIDFLAIAPWYASLFFTNWDISGVYFRVFRLLRVFKGEKYIEAFTLLDDVIRAKKEMLITTSFVAGVTWVVCSSLMYYGEMGNPWGKAGDTYGYYDTIPDSMWVTLLNLTGEWPLADYNGGACLVGVFMSICAIAIFGNFTGIIADGFQGVFDDKQQRKMKVDELGDIFCTRCKLPIDHMYWLDADSDF